MSAQVFFIGYLNTPIVVFYLNIATFLIDFIFLVQLSVVRTLIYEDYLFSGFNCDRIVNMLLRFF